MGNMKYGLLLKMVDRTLRRSLRTWDYVQECLKKENCTVNAPDVGQLIYARADYEPEKAGHRQIAFKLRIEF